MKSTRQVIPFTRPASSSGSEVRALAPNEGEAVKAEPASASVPAYEWKHWSPESFGVLSENDKADLAALLRKTQVEIPEGASVLDIGFGRGAFLQFGRQRKWKMHGTEVNPGLLQSAWHNGFQVTQTETLESFPSQFFEMVAAFDVMEHLELETLPLFLSEVRRVLKPDGVFVARFPNGDSPFGRHIQNGDVNHKTAIGSIRASFLATQAGFEVVFLGCEVQAIFAGRSFIPHRLFAVPMKKLMNAFLNLVFSPRDPIPFCSASLELVLRKPNP